jgi:hypothetical protein
VEVFVTGEDAVAPVPSEASGPVICTAPFGLAGSAAAAVPARRLAPAGARATRNGKFN